MARIAFLQNKLGKTDGVSLEVDKWRAVLEKMGHTVFYCAGNDDVPGVHCVPELSLFHPLTNKILKNGTVKLTDYASEEDLARDIQTQAGLIKEKVLAFIQEQHIDVLVPNNLLSIGYNVPALLALPEVIRETGLPTIAHCHDFYFEDSGEVTATCPTVLDIMERNAPPPYPNVQTLVINRLAQRALKERKGIDATVVPNVFDFDQPLWQADAYNRDFRTAIGVGENDLLFLQATRILDRKGVELAIDVVAELNEPAFREQLSARPLYNGKRFSATDKIVLVCSGYVEKFGISGDYYGNLVRKAAELGVEMKFVGDIVKHSRGTENGQKIFSLWDSYVAADFVTYPSTWEGWGNQFIEAVFAKLPVVLFEYPVYVSDLRDSGFQVVSLGDTVAGKDQYGLTTVAPERITRAAEEAVAYLTDADLRRRAVDRNFAIARERYSFQTLQTIITRLLANIGL